MSSCNAWNSSRRSPGRWYSEHPSFSAPLESTNQRKHDPAATHPSPRRTTLAREPLSNLPQGGWSYLCISGTSTQNTAEQTVATVEAWCVGTTGVQEVWYVYVRGGVPRGANPSFRRPSRLRCDHVICILAPSIRSRTNLRYADLLQDISVERERGAHQFQNRSAGSGRSPVSSSDRSEKPSSNVMVTVLPSDIMTS